MRWFLAALFVLYVAYILHLLLVNEGGGRPMNAEQLILATFTFFAGVQGFFSILWAKSGTDV